MTQPSANAPSRARRVPAAERSLRCQNIRDAALAVLQQRGVMEMTQGRTPLRVTRADLGELLMILNTPFAPRPAPSDAQRYLLAQAGRRPMLPYALDIWYQRRKVFAVSWDDNELEVVAFLDGEWTRLLPDQQVQP